MLKISLDEAYVFDLLSIHEVKINNSDGEKLTKSVTAYNALSKEIVDQIGEELFAEIVCSQSYKDLVIANQVVFDLVDRANETTLSKETADANYQRYIKKVELQQKHFKNDVTEIKL